MNYYITPKGRERIEEYIESQPLSQDRDYTLNRGPYPPLDVKILSNIYSMEDLDNGAEREDIIKKSTLGRVTRQGGLRTSNTEKAFDRLESQGFIARG